MSRRKKHNRERTWFTILQTIARKKGQAAAWCYATALRGPDTSEVPWNVKVVFTAPLRARGKGLVVADEGSYYHFVRYPVDVLKALRLLVSKDIPCHYLKHLISAWYVLEPRVAQVLERVLRLKRALEVEQDGRNTELGDLCVEYMREVAGWLERTNVLPEKENKDE